MECDRPMKAIHEENPMTSRIDGEALEPDSPGVGADRRDAGRWSHPAARKRRGPRRPRAAPRLDGGGRSRGLGRRPRQHDRSDAGGRSNGAAGDARLPLRYRRARRQVRRRTGSAGRTGSAPHTQRSWHRDAQADRARQLDQRGGRPLRTGHDLLRARRRSLHSRIVYARTDRQDSVRRRTAPNRLSGGGIESAAACIRLPRIAHRTGSGA